MSRSLDILEVVIKSHLGFCGDERCGDTKEATQSDAKQRNAHHHHLFKDEDLWCCCLVGGGGANCPANNVWRDKTWLILGLYKFTLQNMISEGVPLCRVVVSRERLLSFSLWTRRRANNEGIFNLIIPPN